MNRSIQSTRGQLGISRLLALLLLGGLISFVYARPASAATLSYDSAGNTVSQQSAAPTAPTITGQPVPLLAAAPGRIAGFSVTIASPSPVTYQWSFNGVLIPGATGDSLLLTTVTAATEGSYTVTVTNSTGSLTSQATALAFDSNSNGLGDAWELQYFGNLNQKSYSDPDGDQLTNVEEFQNGTNPNIRDAYYWTATSGDFDNPANWNWKRVPGLGDTAFINSGAFTFGTSGTASKVNLTVNVPYSFPATTDYALPLTGTWNLNGPITIPSGRTLTVTSGTLNLNGATALAGASLVASGNNTKFNVNGITTYTQPDNTEVEWRAGGTSGTHTGCELNFPNLTTITGGVTTQNTSYYFDLIGRTGATLNLPALTTITVPAETASIGKSGVKLSGIDSGVLSAPALAQFVDATALSNSWVIAHTDGQLLVPLLTAPRGVQLNLATPFNLQQFVTLERTWFIRLLGGVSQINISNIDYVREIYAINPGTKLSFPNVTSYTQPNNTNVIWRAGEPNRSNADCELNFPYLTTITGGVTTQNSNYYFDLIGRTGATLNLPALTAITVPAETASIGKSGVRLNGIDSGVLRAPALAQFADATALSNSWVIAHTGGQLLVPLLTAPQGVQLDLATPFNLQQFVTLERTWFIRLLGGVSQINISNIDYVREIYAINPGTKLSFPNVTSYTQPNNTNVIWRAGEPNRSNVGCELNFPNLTMITGGVTTQNTSYYFDLTARTGATLNLPSLTTITVPAETASIGSSGVRFYSLDSGNLYAAKLTSFTDFSVPGASRVESSTTSNYRFTSLRQSGLTGIVLSGVTLLTGPVVLNPPVITSPATVSAFTGNAFSYQIVATNAPYVFALSAVPAGLTFNPDTGLLTGEPAGFGAVALTMSAFNPDGVGTSPLTLTFTAPPSVLAPSEMYAWWTGDVDGRDAFGSQNGTLQGGVTIQPGRVGNAFTFTGTGHGVTLPQSPVLDLSRHAAWTVEAWIFPTSFTGSDNPTIYALGDYRASLGLNKATGKLESWINNGNRLNTTQTVPLNRWTHVAMSYSGTNRVFYINGVNVGSGTAPAITDVNVASSIGNVTGSPSNSQFFGKIDELAVYGRALTGAEIAAIHASGITGKALPPATFNSWRTSQFTTAELADLAISGPLSDADKDGLSNLLEYALGLNPKIAESAGQPQVGTSEGNLTLRYAKARSDITYTVLTSTDLRSPALWTTTGVTQGTPDSNGNVTASVPLTAPHRFLRLQVTLLP